MTPEQLTQMEAAIAKCPGARELKHREWLEDALAGGVMHPDMLDYFATAAEFFPQLVFAAQEAQDTESVKS